jgi:TolB-like protein/class 3 adenylate cyclase/tetratricopeptide (TPR) repeat protein
VSQERAKRRLAAILVADVVGYSRLMEVDEAGTLAALRRHRAELIDPAILQYGGRIVGSAGDGLLCEFPSVVDAVQCAVEIQSAMPGRNAGLPDSRQMNFRIGINLGDVIVEGNDIFGDGVNVAARLESLTEPGSVYVSDIVREQATGKLPYGFEDRGEHNFKNIARPVRVWAVQKTRPERGHKTEAGPPSSESHSIAVLPFVNMSSDPEQEYFADGITEDIITDLSRWRTLSVTSRNSTFRFKGKPVDTQQIGRELGVRYLVEGSVRRMGERIRVTAQLIDTETGSHVWAERYDRPMAELFALQDEVVRTIVGTLVGRLQASGAERARRKPPSSMAAYDHMLRGNALPWDDPASAAEAKQEFERAIEIDPGYALPYSLLAEMHYRDWMRDFSGSKESLDRACSLAQRAVELAENESTCQAILGQILADRKSFELAQHHMERGIEINPANQWNRADLGIFLAQVGRAEEGLELLRKARRLDPYFGPPWYWRGLGLAEFVLRRYADAVGDFERAATNAPCWALALMAACCAKLGQQDRAQELVAQCKALHPDVTVEKLLEKLPFKYAADSDHLAECLRLAGFPER